MITSNSRSYVLLIFIFISISNILLFQNCSENKQSEFKTISTTDNTLLQSQSGNGHIYDGKIFISRTGDQLCPDGSDIRNEIEVSGQNALMTKEDCQRTTKSLNFTELNLMPHNPSNIIFNDSLFDDSKQERQTAYLCRSHYKMRFTEGEHRVIGDFLLKANAKNHDNYVGQFKFGYYRYNMTLAGTPFDSGDLQISKSLTTINNRQFSLFKSKFKMNEKEYTSELKLRMDNLEGWLDITSSAETIKKTPSIHDNINFGFRVLCYKQIQ